MDNTTDKKLAVELTSAYINSITSIKDQTGKSLYQVKEVDVIKLLNDFYNELKKLD